MKTTQPWYLLSGNKTKKDKKESEASASNNPSTNGQVTTSTNSQSLTSTNVPQCDELEKSKKIKRIKAVRMFTIHI